MYPADEAVHLISKLDFLLWRQVSVTARFSLISARASLSQNGVKQQPATLPSPQRGAACLCVVLQVALIETQIGQKGDNRPTVARAVWVQPVYVGDGIVLFIKIRIRLIAANSMQVKPE